MPSLRSLSAGITATKEDCVNCHYAVDIGCRMQETFNNVKFSNAKIKRKLGKVYCLPNYFIYSFSCTGAKERYEFPAALASLFKERLMWKLDKPQLRTTLTSDIKDKTLNKAKTTIIL